MIYFSRQEFVVVATLVGLLLVGTSASVFNGSLQLPASGRGSDGPTARLEIVADEDGSRKVQGAMEPGSHLSGDWIGTGETNDGTGLWSDDAERGSAPPREDGAIDGGDESGYEAGDKAGDYWVHVAGAVNSPGVYQLPAGSRVVAAVEAAGGPTGDAALEMVNLAAPLGDGQQIYIPSREERAAGQGTFQAGGTVRGGFSKININLADARTLEELPGIGPTLALRIIQERERHGRFQKIEDLTRVTGIGTKNLELLKDFVTVD